MISIFLFHIPLFIQVIFDDCFHIGYFLLFRGNFIFRLEGYDFPVLFPVYLPGERRSGDAQLLMLLVGTDIVQVGIQCRYFRKVDAFPLPGGLPDGITEPDIPHEGIVGQILHGPLKGPVPTDIILIFNNPGSFVLYLSFPEKR